MPVLPHKCMWNTCSMAFATPQELVEHVNSHHLWYICPQHTAIPEPHPPDTGTPGIACLWNQCTAYPDTSAIPSTSSLGGTGCIQPFVDLLTCHLLQEHLGIAPQMQTHQPGVCSHEHAHGHSESDAVMGSADEGCHQDSNERECTLDHTCRWENCRESFVTCDELTRHITAVHVGSGKTQYHCQWRDCTRNGEHAFSSKQKILRHIQVKFLPCLFNLSSSQSLGSYW